jgi:energy-converting hydrogenase Eha subunit E
VKVVNSAVQKWTILQTEINNSVRILQLVFNIANFAAILAFITNSAMQHKILQKAVVMMQNVVETEEWMLN